MSNYDETLKGIKEKVNASNEARGRITVAVSNSDMNEIAHSMLNTPEHTVNVYNVRGDEPVAEQKKPVERYRASLIPMARALGVDKHDAERVMDIPMSKEHASALVEVSTHIMHDYLLAGRKISMPVTGVEEAAMQLSAVRAPEREAVNRFGGDGSITVTKERTIVKATNKVPKWLKGKK